LNLFAATKAEAKKFI